MDVWRSRSSRAAAAESGDGAADPAPPVPAHEAGVRLDQTPPPRPPAPPPAGGAGALPDPMAPQPGEMPFLDHLEELRWRIFKGLGGVVACSLACLFFADWIVSDVLLGPTRTSFFMYDVLGLDPVELTLQNRTITGQFFAYFGTVLATGIVLGSPIVVYQAWKFIEPGLYPEERQGLRFASVFATGFFVTGIAFGYLVISPIALQFFAQFQVAETIVNEFDISRYFSMLLTWAFGAGVLFELPVVVVVLTKLGVVSSTLLRTGRRFALVIILVLSAFLTPPDPLSQIIMAVPLLLLYELSIVLAGVVEKREREALAEGGAG